MRNSRTWARKLSGIAVLSAAIAMGSARTALAATPPASGTAKAPLVVTGVDEKTGSLRLLVNKSAALTTNRPYKRVSINQPDIAEANLISPTKILIDGKKAGATQLIIWDEDDNSQTIDVLVQANLLQLRDLYSRLLPTSKIDVIDNEGTIALTGQVPTVGAADSAGQLASGYGNKILNMLEVAGGQQIILQVRFAEVSKSATSQLGINLGVVGTSGGGGSNIGQVNPDALFPGAQGSILGANPNPFNGIERAADAVLGPNVTQYGWAQFGSVYVEAFIQAMRDNNLIRVLAEPNLVTTSGQAADFLAGGEFPIPIVQGGNDSGTSITVEFKKFGVQLEFTPVVLGNGRLRLKMAPEVSDVDFTFAVESGGFRIPGTRTRRMSTVVEMAEGQTFAVGGLLDSRVSANKSVTPLLGDLPVLGALFRSVRYQRSETELVVLVTPRIVKALNPGDVPALPGEDWRHPSEANLFLNQDLGGARHEDKEKMDVTPRRFIGNYGLIPATQPSEGSK